MGTHKFKENGVYLAQPLSHNIRVTLVNSPSASKPGTVGGVVFGRAWKGRGGVSKKRRRKKWDWIVSSGVLCAKVTSTSWAIGFISWAYIRFAIAPVSLKQRDVRGTKVKIEKGRNLTWQWSPFYKIPQKKPSTASKVVGFLVCFLDKLGPLTPNRKTQFEPGTTRKEISRLENGCGLALDSLLGWNVRVIFLK